MRTTGLAISLLLLLVTFTSAGEPENRPDRLEELRTITRALRAEKRLAETLEALDRPEVGDAGARICALEGLRQKTLLRLAGRMEMPARRTPASAVPPAPLAILIAKPGWAAADPAYNEAGLWEAVHLKTGLVFVLVPGGSYIMGSEERGPKVKPCGIAPRRVTVEPFLICKTECTQEAWKRGVGPWKIEIPPGDRLPMVGYSWFTYKSWCERNGLRLPTEPEWEYAARAGTRTLWHFGDEEKKLDAYVWFKGNSGNELREVAGLLPNRWGLYDMHGNASEFVGDPGDKVGRVYRGGSYCTTARGCRSAYRYIGYSGGYITRYSLQLGFRPAVSLPDPEDEKAEQDAKKKK